MNKEYAEDFSELDEYDEDFVELDEDGNPLPVYTEEEIEMMIDCPRPEMYREAFYMFIPNIAINQLGGINPFTASGELGNGYSFVYSNSYNKEADVNTANYDSGKCCVSTLKILDSNNKETHSVSIDAYPEQWNNPYWAETFLHTFLKLDNECNGDLGFEFRNLEANGLKGEI